MQVFCLKKKKQQSLTSSVIIFDLYDRQSTKSEQSCLINKGETILYSFKCSQYWVATVLSKEQKTWCLSQVDDLMIKVTTDRCILRIQKNALKKKRIVHNSSKRVPVFS